MEASPGRMTVPAVTAAMSSSREYKPPDKISSPSKVI